MAGVWGAGAPMVVASGVLGPVALIPQTGTTAKLMLWLFCTKTLNKQHGHGGRLARELHGDLPRDLELSKKKMNFAQT